MCIWTPKRKVAALWPKRKVAELWPKKKVAEVGFPPLFFRANLEDESGGIWAQNMKEGGAEMILTKKSGARINVHSDPHNKICITSRKKLFTDETEQSYLAPPTQQLVFRKLLVVTSAYTRPVSSKLARPHQQTMERSEYTSRVWRSLNRGELRSALFLSS